MKNPNTLALVVTAQISTLVFSAIASYTAVYLQLVCLIVGCAHLLWNRPKLITAPSFMLLGAMVAIALTLPFNWHSLADSYGFVAILPLALAPGLAALLIRVPELRSPTFIGLLSVIGAGAALAGGIYENQVLGIARPGLTNNPIHFANLVLIVGFFSLVGLFGSKSPWRFLFFLGPVFALLAVLLSGSRGPLLAASAISMILSPFFIVWFRRERFFWIAVGAFAVAIPALLLIGNEIGDGRAISVFQRAATAVLTNDLALVDYVRVGMYQGALGAFLESPFVGHGYSEMYAAATRYFPPEILFLNPFEHLHSDLADFAVMSGFFGLVAYGLILASPFSTLRRCDNNSTFRAVLTAALVLAVGYFALGLTNAVFGVLPQTVLYTVLLANIIAMTHTNLSDT